MSTHKLQPGDVIGLISPSHVATAERYKPIIAAIRSLGFVVKEGKHFYKNTYGYSATEYERADDLNQMIADDDVKMVLFGGGMGGNELLPYIDYENIKKHPKFICSYSDGTTILNAIYSKTGLVTYYGQSPGIFDDLRHYDYIQFTSHFIQGNPDEFISKTEWFTVNGGACEGILVGGYTLNFALLINSEYFSFVNNKKYILFLEDYEKFSEISEVSAYLSHVEQSGFIHQVSGLLFGHYSATVNPELLQRLARFGKKHDVPVVYCDDFGHGSNHAILPIGCYAHLNADEKKLRFVYCAST